MDCEIRRVRVGDENILAYIQTTSWKNAFNKILSEETLEKLTEINKATMMYKKLLEDKKGNGYILEVNGNPHCMAWWDAARDEAMDGYAELICIHSLPDKWGEGYGSKMMKTLLHDIKKSGFDQVLLWVFVDNIRARRFYEALGFVATDKITPAFGTKEICYIKNLFEMC